MYVCGGGLQNREAKINRFIRSCTSGSESLVNRIEKAETLNFFSHVCL